MKKICRNLNYNLAQKWKKKQGKKEIVTIGYLNCNYYEKRNIFSNFKMFRIFWGQTGIKQKIIKYEKFEIRACVPACIGWNSVLVRVTNLFTSAIVYVNGCLCRRLIMSAVLIKWLQCVPKKCLSVDILSSVSGSYQVSTVQRKNYKCVNIRNFENKQPYTKVFTLL